MEKALCVCPKCERRFAKPRQWHSCLAQSVDQHFRGRDQRLEQTYDLLVVRLSQFGPLRVDAIKTSINLISKHHLGGLSVREDYFRLGFLSENIITDERIIKAHKISANRVGYSVILRSPQDIDDQLMSWLKKAYNL